MELTHKAKFYIFNKRDQIQNDLLLKVQLRKYPHYVLVSTLDDQDMKELRTKILEYFLSRQNHYDFFIPFEDGLSHSQIKKLTNVVTTSVHEKGLFYRVRTPEYIYQRLGFQHYQLSAIDKLIELNILSMTPNAVIFRSKKQVAMLHKLFKVGAINYNLVSPEARTEIDSMIAKEWLITKNSLLTKEESSLFNYYLNQKDFGNGLDLRNKYLHGSQGSGDDETEHYRTYIIAIELLMLLVLKINNDFFINDSFNEA